MKVEEKREQMRLLSKELNRVAGWLYNYQHTATMGQLRVLPHDIFTRAKRRLGLIRYIFNIPK